jgi:hypothetical protein
MITYNNLTLQTYFFILKKTKRMSRKETLKDQYPHFNLTILDLLSEIDGTKSHKYLQLLCKIFKKKWIQQLGSKENLKDIDEDNKRTFERLGINLSEDPLVNVAKRRYTDLFNYDDLELFQQFKHHMESNRIEETDLTKYDTILSLSQAVSYASIKLHNKTLEKQVHKEFEDDKWLVVRPLSFESSSVYGSGTKWCTTFKREKDYFFKYFHTGALVYILNKKTGYKFAMFVEIHEGSEEITFWNAEDNRVDFLSLDLDDYLIPILRKIKTERKKNSEFLSKSDLFEVASECNSVYRLTDELLVVKEAIVETVEYPREPRPMPEATMRA